eukprot:10389729-Alexandrium_andersonii.AAC.1
MPVSASGHVCACICICVLARQCMYAPRASVLVPACLRRRKHGRGSERKRGHNRKRGYERRCGRGRGWGS